MKKKLKIEVEVWGIEVEETQHYKNGNGSGWFKFEYSIKVNSGKKKTGDYDGSWSSQTKKQFERVLKGGYAAKQVVAMYY